MASIIPNFEYDIFVSYRHNDNLDGWVTEFVQKLDKELRSTLKDNVNIYFDMNPHDGLLETHNVDKSLGGKLRSLIFIPIISQTYCDSKSFAWQHEFCAFNKLAKDDQFGRDIKLRDGNVASRILPIKIHDLEVEDKTMIENELGGTLRAIEFIYKEAGVNRPLRFNEESNAQNLNQTIYRNQLNKVANTIKAIITAIRNSGMLWVRTSNIERPTSKSAGTRKPVIISIALLLAILAGYFLYRQLTTKSEPRTTTLDKSIAVLPFVNISNDPEQEYFSDGISEELIDVLSKIPELKVIARPSSFSFKGRNEDVREIGRRLNVGNLLSGSVRKSGLQLRISANLIKVSDGSNIWSKIYEYELKEIFKIQEDVANNVVKELRAKLVLNSNVKIYDNNEVYDLLLHAKFLRERGSKEDIAKSIGMLEKAISIDSTDARVWAVLSLVYNFQIIQGYVTLEKTYEKSKQAALRSIRLDNNYADGHYALGSLMHSHEWDDWSMIENEYQIAFTLEPGSSSIMRGFAALYSTFGRFDMAIELAKKTIEIDPITTTNYYVLGNAYLLSNQYEKALEVYKKGLLTDPEGSIARGRIHSDISKILLLKGKAKEAIEEAKLEVVEGWRLHAQSIAYYNFKQTIEADRLLKELIEKYSIGFAYQIACVYSMRNNKDKAFEWLNEAYLQHDNGLTRLLGEPFLRNLEKDPRYLALLKKMNFPK